MNCILHYVSSCFFMCHVNDIFMNLFALELVSLQKRLDVKLFVTSCRVIILCTAVVVPSAVRFAVFENDFSIKCLAIACALLSVELLLIL